MRDNKRVQEASKEVMRTGTPVTVRTEGRDIEVHRVGNNVSAVNVMVDVTGDGYRVAPQRVSDTYDV